MTQVLGLDCKAYYNDVDAGGSGTIASPNWLELDVIKDVTLNLAMAEADVTTRAAGGIEIMEPSLLQISVSAMLKWLNNDTQCTLLWDAFFARTALDLMILTGESTDTNAVGVRGDFKVLGFPRKEELATAVEIDLTLKPSRSIRANYVAKAAGA